MGAGLALVIGSFLPWAKITAPLLGSVTKSGMEGGDGLVTLAAGVVAIVLGGVLMGALSSRKTVGVVLILVAVGVVALCFFEFADVARRFADLHSEDQGLVLTSYGSGLWLIGLAAVATGIGGALALGDR